MNKGRSSQVKSSTNLLGSKYEARNIQIHTLLVVVLCAPSLYGLLHVTFLTTVAKTLQKLFTKGMHVV